MEERYTKTIKTIINTGHNVNLTVKIYWNSTQPENYGLSIIESILFKESSLLGTRAEHICENYE